MKAVILAGGYGTRISEESALRPKPMVEIGGKPILWHIMKIYSAHGIDDFIIAAGYRGYMIKEYFANYYLHVTDVRVDLRTRNIEALATTVEPWTVSVVDTGDGTMTGGRLKRLAEHIGGETFCLSYGDCVSNIDVTQEIEFHRATGAVGTVAAIQPPGRFGALTLKRGADEIVGFLEKPAGDGGWVNGGFFVFEPELLDRIEGDQTPLEGAPLEALAHEGRLAAYRHHGYWQNMDTLRDKAILEDQWASGSPPWKIW
jgi:glucose-1-phosphate cytidylyltransferase